MTDNLDKWIKDAKSEVPDPGEYRRLNRAMIKERMLARNPDRPRRHTLLLVGASVVFLILLSGQISQLGSDDFDRTSKVVDTPLIGPTTVYTDEFRKTSVNLPKNYTEADRDEFYRSSAAGEGEITMVTGLSYGGKTSWLKHIRKMVNEKVSNHGEPVRNPESVQPDDLIDFLVSHMADLKARTKAEPPHETMQMEFDGVMIDLKSWTYDYPGYGPVTSYNGFPVTTP